MSLPILTRIASGECDAVAECVAKYSRLIRWLVRRYVKNCDDAEDVTQDIFVDLWRSAARFNDAVANEITFVSMIARRRLIDCRRKHKRMRTISSIPINYDRALDEQHDNCEFIEDVDWARRQMFRLRPIERTVLEMLIDDGASQSQIAEALHLPLGTVKTISRRGSIRLRDYFLSSRQASHLDRITCDPSRSEAAGVVVTLQTRLV